MNKQTESNWKDKCAEIEMSISLKWERVWNNSRYEVTSEVAGFNMTTGQEVLQYLIDAGEASKAKVQWGKNGDRNVVIFQGNKVSI